MHSSICKTYLVKWSLIDLWLIGGEGGGMSVLGICVFFCM